MSALKIEASKSALRVSLRPCASGPARCRTIQQVSESCVQRGAPFPQHLVIQSDNTVSQAKNSHVTLFLAYLVAKYKFATATLNFLMVGHTHEDIDQFFAIVCALILSKGSYETPQEILTYLVEHLRPRFLQRGEEMIGEFVRGVRDFQAWLAPLGVHLHNAFANRDGVESPHSFAFKLRRDCGGAESSDLPVMHLGDPEDVLCCVKAYMRDTALQQQPVLVLRAPRKNLVREAEPRDIVPVRALTGRETDSYVELCNMCETELGLARAAQALRDLIYKREYIVPRRGWLSEPGCQRRMLPSVAGNPYFPHLPETSFALKVQRVQDPGGGVQPKRRGRQ